MGSTRIKTIYGTLAARLLWMVTLATVLAGFTGLYVPGGLEAFDEMPALPLLIGGVVAAALFLSTLLRDGMAGGVRGASPADEEFVDAVVRDVGLRGLFRISEDGHALGLKDGPLSRGLLSLAAGLLMVTAIAWAAAPLLPDFMSGITMVLVGVFPLGLAALMMGLVLARPEPEYVKCRARRRTLDEIMGSGRHYGVLGFRLILLVAWMFVPAATWYILMARLDGGAADLGAIGYLPWLIGIGGGAGLFAVTLVRDRLARRTGRLWLLPLGWRFNDLLDYDAGRMALHRISAASGRARAAVRSGFAARALVLLWRLGFAGSILLANAVLYWGNSLPLGLMWLGAVVISVYADKIKKIMLRRPEPRIED